MKIGIIRQGKLTFEELEEDKLTCICDIIGCRRLEKEKLTNHIMLMFDKAGLIKKQYDIINIHFMGKTIQLPGIVAIVRVNEYGEILSLLEEDTFMLKKQINTEYVGAQKNGVFNFNKNAEDY